MQKEHESVTPVEPRQYAPLSSIELQSMVDSHEEPFVVIDRNYSIVDGGAIGKMCYQVSHGKDRPCHEEGEDCPHGHIFDTGKPCVCAHVHVDANHRMHQVRVQAAARHGPR